jgi:hypothetical protein
VIRQPHILNAAYRRLRPLFAAVLALMMLFSFHSCDEDLPTYVEPSALLEAKIDGEYFLSDTEHSLRVYLRVTNRYDETLDGSALLSGHIVVFSARDTTVRKSLTLTRASLVQGSISPSGLLKIDPNETIILKGVWDFPGNSVIDDSGRNLSGGDSTRGGFFKIVKDPECPFRYFAQPEDFVLKGSVTLFSQRAPVSAGPTVFRFCYVTNFVDVRVCPRVITVTPCSNWP